MPRKDSQKKLQEWNKRISEQCKSGLSIKAWCAQTDTAPRHFFYWRKKLYSEVPSKRSDFIELPDQNRKDPKSSGVILVYAGIKIQLDQQFDPATLKRCLVVIKEAVC